MLPIDITEPSTKYGERKWRCWNHDKVITGESWHSYDEAVRRVCRHIRKYHSPCTERLEIRQISWDEYHRQRDRALARISPQRG